MQRKRTREQKRLGFDKNFDGKRKAKENRGRAYGPWS